MSTQSGGMVIEMGDEKIGSIYFFGAGKRGQTCLKVFKDYGIVPDGILDNNRELCGKMYENVMVNSPDILRTVHLEKIFITCNSESEIYCQLLDLGVGKKKIVTGYHDILNHLIYYSAQKAGSVNKIKALPDKHGREKIIFDLQNGLVLGGVEAWSYEQAKNFKRNGYQGVYLTTDTVDSAVADYVYPVCILNNREYETEKDRIKICVEKIIEHLPCTIICNFPQQIFWSACIVRRLYPDHVRVIAVHHSDDELYYHAYSLWQKEIDKCMVISSQIKNKLLFLGMEGKKISYLKWKVVCEEYINRTWNKVLAPLQIGYAGRITVVSKRIDVLPELAVKLKEKNICCQINIAGSGEYEAILQQRVKDENIEKGIMFAGYIDREYLPDFWKNQDIMISCSEREGHSISQSEAMAAGAVPVITDVSGARDDVTDGYNGFVVPVGDVDALADRICYLYYNRDELVRMGKCAHDTIYERQKNLNQTEFWNKLLKEVWES